MKTFFLAICTTIVFNVSSFAQCAWTKGFDVDMYDEVTCAGSTMNSNGNMVFGGNFNGKTLKLDNFVLTNTKYVPGFQSDDIFVASCDSSGKLLWATKIGGPKHDNMTGITCDPEGNAFVTGFSGGAVITVGSTKTNVSGCFIVKLDKKGIVTWVKSMSETGNLMIKLDAENNIYCTGAFRNSFDLDGTQIKHSENKSNDVFIAKLDKTGKLLWQHSMGSEGNDLGEAIAVDSKGNVVLFAEHRGMKLDVGGNILNGTGSSINPQLFSAKYSSTGQLLWVKERGYGATFSDHCICDKQGNVFLAENFVPKGLKISKVDSEGNSISLPDFSLDEIKALHIDKEDRLYYAGTFREQKIVFGTDSLVNSNKKKDEEGVRKDAFVCNFTADGKPYSSYTYHGVEGDSEEEIRGITVDESGAIYVCGNMKSNTLRSKNCELNFTPYHTAFFISKIVPSKK